MQKDNKSILIFFISMLVTLVILGIILCVFLIITEKITQKENTQRNNELYEIKPKPADNLDFLFVCCEKIEDEPTFISYITYDACTGAITGKTYDKALILSKDGARKPLYAHYTYAGAKEMLDALKENNEDIKTDYYILLSGENLSYLVDFLGGVNYNLTAHQAEYLDSEPGEQLLDGRRFTRLFFAVDYNLEYDKAIQKELLSLLIKNGLNDKYSLSANSFNNVLTSNSETNIPITELFKRSDGFNYNIKHKTFSVSIE